jgi:hypothetical protein
METAPQSPNQRSEEQRIASAAKRFELQICAPDSAGIRAVLLRALALIDEVDADPENIPSGWVGGLHSAPETWSCAAYEHTATTPYFQSDSRRPRARAGE